MRQEKNEYMNDRLLCLDSLPPDFNARVIPPASVVRQTNAKSRVCDPSDDNLDHRTTSLLTAWLSGRRRNENATQ